MYFLVLLIDCHIPQEYSNLLNHTILVKLLLESYDVINGIKELLKYSLHEKLTQSKVMVLHKNRILHEQLTHSKVMVLPKNQKVDTFSGQFLQTPLG